jgi:flagellar FliJ protein
LSRFQFRFQTVLNIRNRREEQLQIELAQARQRLAHEQGVMDRLAATREGAMREALAGRSGKVDPDEIGARERYLFALEEKIAAQRHALAMLEREVDRKLQETIRAAQETQVMEKLREQYAKAHRSAELREEQKFLDELASIRAARG